MAGGPHLMRNASTERWCAVALILAGSYLLYDAYEKRGQSRPFVTKFLPGG